MKAILYPFASLAAAGLLLSAVVHLGTWVGFQPPPTAYALFFGVFIVWIPTVLVVQRLTRDYVQKDLWKAAFRGAPPWVERAVRWLTVYAIVNFLVFVAFLPKDGPRAKLNEFRLLSGHCMTFYAVALGVLYSAVHAERVDRRRTCLNGHSVSAVSKYCQECGAPVRSTEV